MTDLSDAEAHVNGLVQEYLETAGLEQCAASFSAECVRLGRPVQPPARGSPETDTSSSREQALALFDRGRRSAFFKMLESVTPSSVLQSVQYRRLEFLLNVYFAVYPLRRSRQQGSAVGYMAAFRDYLENKGKQLAGIEELLPFFALPYIPDPSTHPSFRELLQDEWASSLRSEVLSFVRDMTSGAGSPCRLVQLYLSRDLLARQAHHLLVRSHDRLLETQRHYKRLRRRHLRLQDDYRRLIGVTGELTSALEHSVREGGVDLEATLGACCRIFPQLFSRTIQQHATDQKKSSPELILRQSVARHQADSILPAAARFPLDLAAVRHHLQTDSGRSKALLLQALRRRVTRSSSRPEVVQEYVDGDLVGLRHVDDYTRHVLSELTPPEPHLVQQSWARLLNCLASFCAGRTYLCSPGPSTSQEPSTSSPAASPTSQEPSSQPPSAGKALPHLPQWKNRHCTLTGRTYLWGHQPLLDTLLKVLQYQKLDAVTLDMVLATLQKLSLRRPAQSRMIEWGMVEWLVGFLQDHAAIAAYTLEYGCALLMNLCLRTAGRQKCAPHVNSVLKLLTDLLGSSNPQVMPYVNGTLYSLLGQPEIRARATKLGLGQILEFFMEQGSTDLRRQLEYIMRQYHGEGVDGAVSDAEDSDEDSEDTEFLEEDIDADDPVVAEPGELEGEELLATLALGSASASQVAAVPRTERARSARRDRRGRQTDPRAAESDHRTVQVHTAAEVEQRSIPIAEASEVQRYTLQEDHTAPPAQPAAETELKTPQRHKNHRSQSEGRPSRQVSRQPGAAESESPRMPGTSHSDSVLLTGRSPVPAAAAAGAKPVSKSRSEAELAGRRPPTSDHSLERDRLPQIPTAAASRPLPEVTPRRRRNQHTSDRSAIPRSSNKTPSQVTPLRLLERRPTLEEGKFSRMGHGTTNTGQHTSNEPKSRRKEAGHRHGDGSMKTPRNPDQSPLVQRRVLGSTFKPQEPQSRVSEPATPALMKQAPGSDAKSQGPEHNTSASDPATPAPVSRKLNPASALTSAAAPAMALALTAGLGVFPGPSPAPAPTEPAPVSSARATAPAVPLPDRNPAAVGGSEPADSAASAAGDGQPAGPLSQSTAAADPPAAAGATAPAPATAPTTTPVPAAVIPPATDALIQRLPVPAVHDFVAAFSSRPRISRTPPPPDLSRQDPKRDPQQDPVLPPIG